MKNKNNKRNIVVQLIAVILLTFASLISYSGSLLLNGEPEPPKSLIR